MPFLTATLAVLLLVGIPWAAVSYWVSRRVTGIQDRLEVFALGFAGVGVTTWAVWVASVAGGFNPPIVAAALLCVAGGIVFNARRLGSEPPHRSPGATRGVLLTASIFGLLVAVSFVTFGLVRGDTVHTLAMTDWYKHLTVATSIAAAEQFPPPNPFLLADAEPTYYFGFHLMAALASRFASSPGDVYPSLHSLTIVIATAVPFVLYAYARPSCSERGALLVAGICLLAGFDVAVVLVDTMRAAVTHVALVVRGRRGSRAGAFHAPRLLDPPQRTAVQCAVCVGGLGPPTRGRCAPGAGRAPSSRAGRYGTSPRTEVVRASSCQRWHSQVSPHCPPTWHSRSRWA